MTKTGVELAKADVEAKVTRIQANLDRITFKLNTTEAKLKQAKEQATWSKDQWFTHWQVSEACDENNAEIGQVSHWLGEDKALERLKVILDETCPLLEWNTVWSRYH